MRMTYLIIAHDGEAQLQALLKRLLPADSPDTAIVHIDRRSALWPNLRGALVDPRITVIQNPVAVRWGHWSQVSAIHRLIAVAVQQGCDYAHLLSGSDWPVLGREALVTELSAPPSPLCHIEALPGVQEQRMQTWRLDSRWLQLNPARNRIAYAATWELRRLSGYLDAARDKLGMERSRNWGPWHKGSSWWSLPAEALRVLDRDLGAILRSSRLHGTVCSDEHVIQTIIATRFSDRIADYRRFIVWPESGSSPRLLGAADQPAIAASGAWFARKVSLAHDPFFLDLPN